jgi:hypothetical protein
LNHLNIAATYGLEESGGMTAFAMELIEGEGNRGLPDGNRSCHLPGRRNCRDLAPSCNPLTDYDIP